MKLLYITNGINGSGGQERVLSIKASILAEDYNYEVSILVLNDAEKDPFYDFSPKIRFYSTDVHGNPIQYIKNYKNGIQRIVDQLQPDVISVCDDGLKAFFIPQFLKTNSEIIYERHVSKLIEASSEQGFVKNLLTKSKWVLMEKLAKKFSKFIVLTEGNKNEWKSLRNLEVVPNPLSFYPDTVSSFENKVVICVGKISYQKGQDMLLKAWKIVHEKFPDWRLELYGRADSYFLKTDDLSSKNIYHFPPEKNIEKKYLDSSIYVMPSRYEGFGMVLIEAMACGLPCVSFNCNYGPSDIITNNEDGFLVENGNYIELARRLESLISSSDLQKKMGSAGRENVKKYLPEIIAKDWDDLLKKL